MEQLLAAHQYRRRSSGKNRSQLSELVFHELHSGWSMETAARTNPAPDRGRARTDRGDQWAEGHGPRMDLVTSLMLRESTAPLG